MSFLLSEVNVIGVSDLTLTLSPMQFRWNIEILFLFLSVFVFLSMEALHTVFSNLCRNYVKNASRIF